MGMFGFRFRLLLCIIRKLQFKMLPDGTNTSIVRILFLLFLYSNFNFNTYAVTLNPDKWKVIAPSYNEEQKTIYFLGYRLTRFGNIPSIWKYCEYCKSVEYTFICDAITNGELINATPGKYGSGDIYYIVYDDHKIAIYYFQARNKTIKQSITGIEYKNAKYGIDFTYTFEAFYFLGNNEPIYLYDGYSELTRLDLVTNKTSTLYRINSTDSSILGSNGNLMVFCVFREIDGIDEIDIECVFDEHGITTNSTFRSHGVIQPIFESSVFVFETGIAWFNILSQVNVFDTKRKVFRNYDLDNSEGIFVSTAIWIRKNYTIIWFDCGGKLRHQHCTARTTNLDLGAIPTVSKHKVGEGSKVTLTCGVTGYPTNAHIYWTKDNKTLSPSDPRFKFRDELTLIIISTVYNDRGFYSCNIQHTLPHAGVVLKEMILDILRARPTKIQGWVPHMSTTSGETVVLFCDAWSEKHLTITTRWLKDGTEVDLDSKYYEQVNSSLHIIRTSTSDAGNYTCIAATKIDSVNKTLILEVTDTGDSILNTAWTWIIIVMVICACALATLISIYYYRKMKKNILSLTELKEFTLGNPEVTADAGAEELTDCQPYDTSYELPLETIQIQKNVVLGQGEFGIVCRGSVYQDNTLLDVALKTTKPVTMNTDTETRRNQLQSLMSELKLMIYIGPHSNIIRLVGAYTKQLREGIMYIATEMCVNGSLETLLRRSTFKKTESENANTAEMIETGQNIFVTNRMMSSWAWEIAKGLEHLSSKKVIHSDLATRNVLVSGDMSIRITDFGLSRRLENYTNYKKMGTDPLPWRWMAVESLDRRDFSTQSDVWSYGVTLWEIYSMGSIPYPGITWTLDFVQKFKSGERLLQPEHASNEIYQTMQDCWSLEASARPKPADLANFFRRVNYKDANIVYI